MGTANGENPKSVQGVRVLQPQMAKIKTASFHRRRTVPITEPLPAQVPNSTGGFAWQVTPWDQLDRFLVLGVTGGTYYITEQKLTESNAKSVVECIGLDAQRTLDRIVAVSDSGLAHRNDPAIFALALVLAYAPAEVKTKVPAAVRKVCRTGTHLLHFADYVHALRGGGRTVRRCFEQWYTGQPVERLAYQVVKYQQRDGWSHRDVLRMAHPTAPDPATEAVFRWIVGGKEALGERTVKRTPQKSEHHYPDVRKALPEIINAVEEAKAATKASKIIDLIATHNLPREVIPTQWLDNVEVWDALLQRMPLTAMIRNLGKMSAVGLLKPLSEATKKVVRQLGDAEYLKASRVHPITVLVASKTYGRGAGIKGSLKWTPIPAIESALDEAFYATFGNVRPVHKNLLLALDVSGSMGNSAAGTVLRACEATAALSLVWANTEPNVHVFGFAHQFVELGIRKGMTLETATKKAVQANFGSTDIGLAIQYAIDNRLDVGGFVVMTDNEGNSGSQPASVLAKYRSHFVSDARLVVLATAANQYSVVDPTDKYSLDVVGFDASVPNVVNDFIRGTARPTTEESEPETE